MGRVWGENGESMGGKDGRRGIKGPIGRGMEPPVVW